MTDRWDICQYLQTDAHFWSDLKMIFQHFLLADIYNFEIINSHFSLKFSGLQKAAYFTFGNKCEGNVQKRQNLLLKGYSKRD